jgi:hypothetical protein
MKAVGEVCWARRSDAGLTQIVARRWGSGATWRGTVAVNDCEAGTVVADDRALALHHGEREGGEGRE